MDTSSIRTGNKRISNNRNLGSTRNSLGTLHALKIIKKHLVRSLVFSGFALVFTSCHVSSRVAMNGVGGRNAYNTAIQMTTNEQMLLNLVRLRYVDSPFFLDVNNITSQFTYKTAVKPTLNIPGFNQENPASVGGEFSWQNQPTIQYSPLEGRAFAGQLMQPIDLKIIQQLVYTGWGVDRIFRLTVQSLDDIPNAPLASAPTPSSINHFERFYEITSLLREMQLGMHLQLGVSYKSGHGVDSLADEMQISFPVNAENAEKLAGLFNSTHESKNRYFIDLKLGFNKNAKIGILPRSLLGCMYYISLGIDVPEQDIKEGKVVNSHFYDDDRYCWERSLSTILQVKHSKTFPKNAYLAVQYRNYWFYIDDRDLESKKTFVLLQQLYNLLSIEPRQPPPLLSIPLG